MNQDDKEKLYKNLITLLKLFKNRPYHLAKYLSDNSAFTKDFLEKIMDSNKLASLQAEEGENNMIMPIYFNDISQMNDFYNSIMDDINLLSAEKTKEEITSEINNRLNDCIKKESYEDAAKIRDYMNRNGIKRI
jgi:hypothetical protein